MMRGIFSALMGLIHETGHALYEAGLPAAFAAQPVGAAAGMAALRRNRC